MRCDNNKQPKCKEVFKDLTPENYYTAANINELQAVFAAMNDEILNDINNNLGI